jgi:hypothetical protein
MSVVFKDECFVEDEYGVYYEDRDENVYGFHSKYLGVMLRLAVNYDTDANEIVDEDKEYKFYCVKSDGRGGWKVDFEGGGGRKPFVAYVKQINDRDRDELFKVFVDYCDLIKEEDIIDFIEKFKDKENKNKN